MYLGTEEAMEAAEGSEGREGSEDVCGYPALTHWQDVSTGVRVAWW